MISNSKADCFANLLPLLSQKPTVLIKGLYNKKILKKKKDRRKPWYCKKLQVSKFYSSMDKARDNCTSKNTSFSTSAYKTYLYTHTHTGKLKLLSSVLSQPSQKLRVPQHLAEPLEEKLLILRGMKHSFRTSSRESGLQSPSCTGKRKNVLQDKNQNITLSLCLKLDLFVRGFSGRILIHEPRQQKAIKPKGSE